jgi:threonylcarbamoyladenosine tRNA methylthiotransferase MtaB
MRFFVYTTGCRTNQCDSHIIVERLRKIGLPSSLERADYVIVNACTLTSQAERDARRFIERIKKRREAEVVLVGCHPQVYRERTFSADLVLGQREKFRIEAFIGRRGVFVEGGRDVPMEKVELDHPPIGRTRFFLKIQDGCDRFCTYCVVPLARGRKRSRPFSEIREVMARLRGWGIKEVVLTGIEIGAYADGNMDFKSLLRRLEVEETPERIRIGSLDPLYVDAELVAILRDSKKLAKSLHIPLQSASDRVLKEMGRPYGIKDVEERLEALLGEIDGIGLGLDILTGFPAEDPLAFEETVGFVESSCVYYLHVFPFSRREFTAAFHMRDLPETEKKRRVRVLRALDRRKRREFLERAEGKVFSVLFEGKVYAGGLMRGYTENYIPLYVPYSPDLVNEMRPVRLTGIVRGLPIGEVL